MCEKVNHVCNLSVPISCKAEPPFWTAEWDELSNSFKENSLEVGAGPHQLYCEDPRKNLSIKY